MTKATIELIDQLCDIIDKSKYLILSGTMAVGKTYLAMVEKQYDIFELLDQYFAEKYMMPLSNYIKSKCPEVIKMTSFLSGVYEEASIKMKEAYGIV